MLGFFLYVSSTLVFEKHSLNTYRLVSKDLGLTAGLSIITAGCQVFQNLSSDDV